MRRPRPASWFALLLSVLLLLVCAPRGHAGPEEPAGGGATADDLAWARDVVATRLPTARPVEELPQDPAAWLNTSRPLSFAKDLRGKVVVLDFWCFCCINCMHVLPDLAWLEERYKDQPVAFLGVHSAKFEAEKDRDALREAVRRLAIAHPVLNDGEHAVWGAFGARAWPTFSVVTPDGRLVGNLSGEGHRGSLDALIQAVLEQARKDGVALDPAPLPIRLERASMPAGSLAYPGKVAVHPDGERLFVADSGHHRVLELTREGQFVRAFGDGVPGLVDGGAAGRGEPAARFRGPQGLVVWREALWVADTLNHALRRVDLESGLVTTIAGTGAQGWERRGVHPAAEVSLASPWDLLPFDGGLVIAMAGTHQLWRYDPQAGTVAVWAGDGSERRLDAPTRFAAAFAQPSGLASDGSAIYVADSESSSIVRVTAEGVVETVAGARAEPKDLFHFGDEDGVGHGRRFQHPLGVAWVGDRLWVADTYNHKLKTVTPEGRVTTVLGDGTPGRSDDPPRFAEPAGLAALGTTLYVADTNAHALRRVDTVTGTVTTLRLVGVPVPTAVAAAATVGDEAFAPGPDDVEGEGGPLRLKADAALRLVVAQELPAGWKPTPGVRSHVRVAVPGRPPVLVELVGGQADVGLGPLPVGDLVLDVRLRAYVCEEVGTCRLRSVHWRVPVEVVADGAQEARLVDRFVPGAAAGLLPDLR